MSLSLDNQFFKALADEHRRWLGGFDPQYLANWERLLNADVEAAMCEAAIRRLLESLKVAVQPNIDLTADGRSPDFLCTRSGQPFYVDATCIEEDTVTRRTCLRNDGSLQTLTNPEPLNWAIFNKCIEKASQFKGLTLPGLVAIGTFHGEAAMFSFSPPWPDMILTGMATRSVTIDKDSLSSVGAITQTSELRSAAFLRFENGDEIGFARSSISGLLLCGLSLQPAWIIGLLHPNPARPFDPKLLPRVSFGCVEVSHKSGDLRVHWPEGNDA